MKFECYSNWSQLPARADSLFEQAAKASVFFSRPWFETVHATALEDDQSLLLAGVVDEDKLLAVLPLVERNGEHRRSLGHRYTPLYSLLLVEENQADVLGCLIEGLSQLPLLSVRLAPVAVEDRNTLNLQKGMESAGYECHRYFRFYNWIVRTRGQSFQDYMVGRPSQVRHTIARKRRKLERDHGYEIIIFRGDEVPQGLTDYHRAYSASWKANEQYQDLLDALATNLAVPGWTRLAVLYIDGKPAATQLWFVAHRKANIFRLAYDEDWKRYSPGSILTAHLMQYVIDVDMVEEIDFLSGNERYKQDWMTERRERWGLVFVKQPEPQSGSGAFVAMLRGMFKKTPTDC